MDKLQRIPIKAAEETAKKYGYHQIIVIARKVGDDGGESVVTYSTSKKHCSVAASIGNFLKFKIMGWKEDG